jgi:hypothetical protein
MSDSTNGIKWAITASRLWDGTVVYLADGGAWRETLAGCRLAANDAECKAMEAVARWAVQTNIVVAPCVIAVAADGVESPRPRLSQFIRGDSRPARPEPAQAN